MAADPEEEEHIPVNMLNRVDLPDNNGDHDVSFRIEIVKSIDFDAFTLMIFFASYALQVIIFLAPIELKLGTLVAQDE